MSPEFLQSLFDDKTKHTKQVAQTISKNFDYVWQTLIRKLKMQYGQRSTIELQDISLCSNTGNVTYILTVTSSSGVVTTAQTIPLILMVDVQLTQNPDDPNLSRYLNQNPARTVSSDNNPTTASRRKMEEILRLTQQQFPNMYIDIPRLVVVEELISEGKMFKVPFDDSMVH